MKELGPFLVLIEQKNISSIINEKLYKERQKMKQHITVGWLQCSAVRIGIS